MYLGFRLTGGRVPPPTAPPDEQKDAAPKQAAPKHARAQATAKRIEGEEVEAAGPHLPAPAHTEIDGLAPGLNRTLGRLEEALERQRRFSSDASHELRTPLTAMRTQIEDALQAPQETDAAPWPGRCCRASTGCSGSRPTCWRSRGWRATRSPSGGSGWISGSWPKASCGRCRSRSGRSPCWARTSS
ncbi:histidine kinase dimerization/phospho-acceptor domain-containing protein [Microbispora rosea]|uniref:histidine kinase dimerization/phospho-acceptor domain-containing protein n=1 Tax=Microbispora rosea TaxID=58117 RepID=UPI00343F195B